MKHGPIVPAVVDFSEAGVPLAPLFGDVYHPRGGAFAQAQQVFLAGNRLPERWRGRARFTIVETGFGLGNNFLATWQAWRADPSAPRRLHFISVEKHPLRAEDLRRAHASSPAPALAQALCEAWPPLTPDFHLLRFDDGQVELLLVLGEAGARLRELVAEVDAFYLDGFAPACNPQMWDDTVFRALSRLAAPGATAATWSAARAVRDGLTQAGFSWRRADGSGGKRDITVADFAPRVTAAPPPARQRPARPAQRIAIVGGGLAGAACAQALAAQGLDCVVLDRHAEPACEGSGNRAGLFHGIVHPDDGLHARAHRAAALLAHSQYAREIAAGVPGDCAGLLRLVPDLPGHAPLADLLQQQGLPAGYAQVWSAAQVEAAGGPRCPAWCFTGGGWISPARLARHWLLRPGIRWQAGSDVAALEGRLQDGGVEWRLQDAQGRLLATADAVVLANAQGAPALWRGARLCDAAGGPSDAEPPPALQRSRGQVTVLAGAVPGLRPPGRPLAGAGYAIALPDGGVLCGATTDVDDEDPTLRPRDHLGNLAQLRALTGGPPGRAGGAVDDEDLRAWAQAGWLDGRVGWRAGTPDRLPWIGAVPARWPGAPARTPNQPRRWPRVPGLYVAAGLGSRGLTWAPLAGRLIAAWITGAPHPVETALVDALDPARGPARRARHA